MKKILTGFTNFFKTMESAVIELISAAVLTLAIIATFIFGNWGWSAISLMIFAVAAMWNYVYRDYTWPFIKKHSLTAWESFKSYSVDRQIAIVLSFVSLITLAFAPWTATFWWVFTTTVIARAIVYREEYTWPAIEWCWDESKPIRKRFTAFASSILFGKRGFPIAVIGWGFVSCIIGTISLFVFKSQNWATAFGVAGLSGLIYGVFFQVREKHLQGCEIKAREAEALATIAKHSPKQTTMPATNP